MIHLLGATWLIDVFLVNAQMTAICYLRLFSSNLNIKSYKLYSLNFLYLRYNNIQRIITKQNNILIYFVDRRSNSNQHETLMRERQHSQRSSTQATSLDRSTSFQFSTLDKKKLLNDWKRDSMIDMPPPIMSMLHL